MYHNNCYIISTSISFCQVLVCPPPPPELYLPTILLNCGNNCYYTDTIILYDNSIKVQLNCMVSGVGSTLKLPNSESE